MLLDALNNKLLQLNYSSDSCVIPDDSDSVCRMFFVWYSVMAEDLVLGQLSQLHPFVPIRSKLTQSSHCQSFGCSVK